MFHVEFQVAFLSQRCHFWNVISANVEYSINYRIFLRSALVGIDKSSYEIPHTYTLHIANRR